MLPFYRSTFIGKEGWMQGFGASSRQGEKQGMQRNCHFTQ